MRDRLELSHLAGHRVRGALAQHPETADRGRRVERGGGGAFVDGRRLARLEPRERFEIVGLETARPELIGEHSEQIARIPSNRVRALGSVALSMCFVADARMDGMLTLRQVRSVDVAAAQLIVREAGGVVAFPDAGDNPALGLDMRSRVAAAGPAGIDGLLAI